METENTQEVIINDPKAVLDALDRAKNDAKKFREEKEKLEIDLDSQNQKIAEFSGRLLHEKIAQKLSSEGLKEPKRLIKFIDTNKLSFNDELDIVGLDEQIEQLKTDLPEIFDPRIRVGGQADTAVKATVSTQFTASQLQAAKILGKQY